MRYESLSKLDDTEILTFGFYQSSQSPLETNKSLVKDESCFETPRIEIGSKVLFVKVVEVRDQSENCIRTTKFMWTFPCLKSKCEKEKHAKMSEINKIQKPGNSLKI